MGYFDSPMGEALDRHITGNYGEDQFDHELDCPDCGHSDRYEIWPMATPDHPDEEGTHVICDCGWSGDESELLDPRDLADEEPDDFNERREETT